MPDGVSIYLNVDEFLLYHEESLEPKYVLSQAMACPYLRVRKVTPGLMWQTRPKGKTACGETHWKTIAITQRKVTVITTVER